MMNAIFHQFFINFSSKIMSEKNSIVEFYKLHHDKGKLYTYSHWKNSSVSRKTKEIDQNMVARMFDNLKAKIHSANENGLSSLL